jgi:hypothetical protein
VKLLSSKLVIAFVLVFCWVVNSYAQKDSSKTDTVSISSIIHSQIETIKSKETPKEIRKPDLSKKAENNTVFLGLSESMLIRIFIFVDILLVTVLFIIWRRRKQRIAAELKAKFKNNIRKLREERIKGKDDLRLKTLRKNLQSHAICNDLNDKLVTDQAKKLSISKGEIYLAAKIKSYKKDDDA